MSRKMTFEEFKNKLSENNEHYKKGYFKIIGTFTHAHGDIIVRTDYGDININCRVLLLGQCPGIESAIDKTEYFKNMYKSFCPNSEIQIIGSYINSHTPILCNSKYGQLLMTPNGLRRCPMPNIRSAVNQKEYYINLLLDKNTYYANGDFELIEDYDFNQKTIKIKNKYGILNIDKNRLALGQNINIQAAENKFEYWCNMAKEKHDNFYSYPEQVYLSAEGVIKIDCPYHGEFSQIASNHLQGSGCPKCRDEKSGERAKGRIATWSYSSWGEAAKNSKYYDVFKVYVISFTINNKLLFKIGKTFLTLKNRLRMIPVENKEVLFTYESDSAHEISKLEILLQYHHKQYKYLPDINFGGRNECFSEINMDLINELCKGSKEVN